MSDNGQQPSFRVAIYARYSSDMQNEISIDDQVARCREEIARRGWRVAGTYTDNAQSGWSLDRDGFQEMRAAAEKGRFQGIIMWKFDRLARDHNHTVMIKALLRHNYGVKLYCVEGMSEDDDDSPYAALVEQMIAVFASFYSRNLSSDTKRAKRAKAMRGEFNGSIAPLGYTLVTKKEATEERPAGLYIDLLAGPVVVRAFERYATGQYSDTDIAAWLNEQPEIQEARRDRKKPLGKDTVRDLLQNRVYTGQVAYTETHYDGSLGQKRKSRRKRIQWFEGKHNALVPAQVFNNCQAIRSRLRKTYTNPSATRTYILPDRVFCARCTAAEDANIGDPHFAKMRIAWSHRIEAAQYRCVARDRGYHPCEQGYVREDIVLAQVVNLLSQMEVPEDVMARIDATVRGRQQNEEALAEVKALEEKIERVQYSWEEGLLMPEDYVQRMHRLQAEIASIRPLDYDRLEDAHDLLTYFRSYWDQCAEVDEPEEARRQLLDKIVDRVFVYDDRVVAIALPTDFGVVMDTPSSAPSEILSMIRTLASNAAWQKKKDASASLDTRTQDGDDGVRTFSGYALIGGLSEYRHTIDLLSESFSKKTF